MTQSILHVAIIGSGPAGYYTAESLSNTDRPIAVDIIDRLATPYGLIRAGVAPDHQSIKRVSKRFEKTALKDTVRFVGNLTIGRDIQIDELMELYDAVILATGAARDRSLGIKGEDLDGVWGSAAFVGWYNSHPKFADLDLTLNTKSVAVIGNGNVALDVARILAKSPGELAGTDISPHAASAIAGSPINDIWIFGRRGPTEASFTPKELGEMSDLARAVPYVDEGQIPPEDADEDLAPAVRKNLSYLRRFTHNRPGEKALSIHFAFYTRPVEILGSSHVEGLRLERTRVENGRCVGTGEYFDIACGLVVPCIGYQSSPLKDVPYDESRGRFQNNNGKIKERLYATGWARRGPTGTIGTNKPDGAEIAERVLHEVKPLGRAGRKGLDQLIMDRRIQAVTFRDWQKIELAEEKAGGKAMPRLKFTRLEDMLEAAGRNDDGAIRKSPIRKEG